MRVRNLCVVYLLPSCICSQWFVFDFIAISVAYFFCVQYTHLKLLKYLGTVMLLHAVWEFLKDLSFVSSVVWYTLMYICVMCIHKLLSLWMHMLCLLTMALQKRLEMSLNDVYPVGSNLDIPKRPPWSYSMSSAELEQREDKYFRVWISLCLFYVCVGCKKCVIMEFCYV